jgi:hypothetical protein
MSQGSIVVQGLEQLRRQLTEFSDRRFEAAIATALTRTAVAMRDEMRREVLPQVFDRPTPYTLNSLYVRPATAQRLSATVEFKDELAVSQQGTPATNYLLPHVQGGARRTKRLEAALQAIGVLQQGWYAVPGQGARLDGYGNVSRGQITEILSQLRIQLVGGFSRNMSFNASKALAAQRRAGGRYFAVPVGDPAGRQPGVYQREFMGRNITPVFVFVRVAAYRRRFDFYGELQRRAQARLPVEIERAVREHIARLASRGRPA